MRKLRVKVYSAIPLMGRGRPPDVSMVRAGLLIGDVVTLVSPSIRLARLLNESSGRVLNPVEKASLFLLSSPFRGDVAAADDLIRRFVNWIWVSDDSLGNMAVLSEALDGEPDRGLQAGLFRLWLQVQSLDHNSHAVVHQAKGSFLAWVQSAAQEWDRSKEREKVIHSLEQLDLAEGIEAGVLSVDEQWSLDVGTEYEPLSPLVEFLGASVAELAMSRMSFDWPLLDQPFLEATRHLIPAALVHRQEVATHPQEAVGARLAWEILGDLPSLGNLSIPQVLDLRASVADELRGFRSELLTLATGFETTPWETGFVQEAQRVFIRDVEPRIADLKKSIKSARFSALIRDEIARLDTYVIPAASIALQRPGLLPLQAVVSSTRLLSERSKHQSEVRTNPFALLHHVGYPM